MTELTPSEWRFNLQVRRFSTRAKRYRHRTKNNPSLLLKTGYRLTFENTRFRLLSMEEMIR